MSVGRGGQPPGYCVWAGEGDYMRPHTPLSKPRDGSHAAEHVDVLGKGAPVCKPSSGGRICTALTLGFALDSTKPAPSSWQAHGISSDLWYKPHRHG